MASRWPQRLPPAASMSFSISRSVRYSRGRADRRTCACGWRQLLHLVLLEHAARSADYPWKSNYAHDRLLQYILELTQLAEC